VHVAPPFGCPRLTRQPPLPVQELTTQLRRVADKENVQKMSHLLFYGPSGAGKKTRIMALLREVRVPREEGGGRRRHASRNRADASPSAQPQPVGLLALLHERVWKGSLEHAHRAPGTDTVRALRKIYGPGVEKLKVDVRAFKFKSSEVEVTFLSSNYHIELNPSDVGPYRHKSSKVLS